MCCTLFTVKPEHQVRTRGQTISHLLYRDKAERVKMPVEPVCLRWRSMTQYALCQRSNHGHASPAHSASPRPFSRGQKLVGHKSPATPSHPFHQHDYLNTTCFSSQEVEIALQHSYFNLYDPPHIANRLAADPRDLPPSRVQRDDHQPGQSSVTACFSLLIRPIQLPGSSQSLRQIPNNSSPNRLVAQAVPGRQPLNRPTVCLYCACLFAMVNRQHADVGSRRVTTVL